jgi:hypothetical protein
VGSQEALKTEVMKKANEKLGGRDGPKARPTKIQVPNELCSSGRAVAKEHKYFLV